MSKPIFKFNLASIRLWLAQGFAQALIWLLNGALFGVGFLAAIAWIAKG